MKKQFKLAAGLAALTLSVGAQAGIIDLFSTDQLVAKDFTNGGVNAASSNYNQAGAVADTTILGGFRDLSVSTLAGGSAIKGSSINVLGGALTFSTDTLVTGTAEVQWDGNDSAIGVNPIYDVNPTGLGAFDLTLGGTVNSFQLITNFSDLGWVFEITMYTDAANWTKVSLDSSAVGSPTASTIPFSAFDIFALCGTYGAAPGVNAITCGGAGADPTNLGALVATLNTGDPLAPDGTGSSPQLRTAAVDLELDSVTTVPEPGVLGLMGIGLLGVALSGRARRKTGA